MKEAGNQSGNTISTSPDIMQVEARNLEEMLEKIESELRNTSTLVDRTEASYQDMKNYMVENRGEIDPSEQFQNELFLNKTDEQSARAVQAHDRLNKLLDSPYFAKIVFKADGTEVADSTYIGRFAFTYDNSALISDWRSPIAGLFYDYDIGPATYQAPSTLVRGFLETKLQFKIEDGKLLYAADSGSSVRDEILQQELSKTSDQKMRSIINSIQREQNAIIRDEDTPTLIIQGVAGSGKTSIALHRIAYLLYQRKDRLSSRSVAILSPNRVFSDYISNVLPELGEEPIIEYCLEDICKELISPSLTIALPRAYLDTDDQGWKHRSAAKASYEFMNEALDYLASAQDQIFQARPLRFGTYTIEEAWLSELFYRYPKLPIDERLDILIAEIILELSSHVLSLGVEGIPTRGRIKSELKKMLRAKDALSLYKQFFTDTKQKKLFVMSDKQTIEWEDAAPLALFQTAFEGYDRFRHIKHLVVDEMQDLTPIQHWLLEKLFDCEKTILGDYHQMIDPGNHMTLSSIQKMYSNSRIVELTTSYRSTFEIIELAKRVKDTAELKAVERHGEEPRLIKCDNTREVLEHIEELIARFDQSGFKTLGILHKSGLIAKRYHELLSQTHVIHLATPESTSFEQGITMCSIKMAKGLEFDEVIILDADSTQFSSEDDRNLLYVAITRAMHKLSILYRLEASPFLSVS